MYAQILLVTSVRGSGFSPTTAPSAGDGVSGFMNAAFGLRFAAFFGAAFFADFLAGAFFAAFFLVAMLSSLHYLRTAECMPGPHAPTQGAREECPSRKRLSIFYRGKTTDFRSRRNRKSVVS